MSRVRHRRRLHVYRFIAGFAPILAVGLSATAFVLDGRWMSAAAAGGALFSLVLGSMVLRLDQRWRVELATVRAGQAAAYAAEQAQSSAEHRSFAAHMIGLLDAASDRIGMQRSRLDSLEAEIAHLRSTWTTPPAPSHELARITDGAEWSDLWPDLAEAPTVVDLLKWDERLRHGLVPDADGHRDEQTA
ncbi:MAG: hypothetical protein ACRDVN_06685 [Jiangellaceae bacterium]